jgi:hypothetical protein
MIGPKKKKVVKNSWPSIVSIILSAVFAVAKTKLPLLSASFPMRDPE